MIKSLSISFTTTKQKKSLGFTAFQATASFDRFHVISVY